MRADKMKNRHLIFQAILAIILMQSMSVACQEPAQPITNTVGTLLNTSEVSDGFILFSVHNKTYLINNCGEVVKEWTSEYAAGKSAYLLENGNLLRAAEVPNQERIIIPGIGGRVELYDWDGNLIWEYNYSSPDYSQHHDIYPMPNGNILLLAVTVMEENEARALGRRLLTPPHRQLYNEQVLELKPVGADRADIVWEWNIKDHLIQNADPGKKNYGVPADHPEKLDINYHGSSSGSANWLHINSMQYDELRDQIVLCSRHLSEIYIIDHSTTTAEAAHSSGGNYQKGGDFLYRWGNPAVYGQGTPSDQKLFGPHAAHWISGDNQHSGRIIIFNNGVHRSPKFSEVDIIKPPVDESGSFMQEYPFGPTEPDYIYKAPVPTDFYSEFLSNAQVLPTRNMLICAGEQGRFFEIDEDGQIVWEYINPVGSSEILHQGNDPGQTGNNVFRATRYPENYQAFKGRQLIPGPPIEIDPDLTGVYNCH